MLRRPLSLTFAIGFAALAAGSLARAGEDEGTQAIDKQSGLQITLPEGWERQGKLENKSRPVVAVLTPDKGQLDRFIRFVAEVASADNYDADQWVAHEKQTRGKWFDKVDAPLAVEERKLGGLNAIGFTMAGSKDDQPVRLRVFHAVRNGQFFQFTEASFANAHTAAGAESVDAVWDGISFGDAPAAIQIQEEVAPKAERVVEDTPGNYKFTLPGNWELERAPPTEAKEVVRVVLLRRDDRGNTVAVLQVIRFESDRAETFTEDSPGDVIQRYIAAGNLEGVFGEKSSGYLTPNIDESVGLGGADKAANWKLSSITMDEKAKKKDAETRIRKGEKGVEVPEFKPSVALGRCAMISPFLYHVWAQIRADVADDATINAEIQKIFNSVEFLSSKSLPPAYSLGPISPGDTTADPQYAGSRTDKLLYTVTGRVVYKLGIEMMLPPGFRRITKDEFGSVFKDSSALSAIIVAQDKENNWATITISHANSKRAGDENKVLGDKNITFEGWKSNWETKARGAKVPAKIKAVNWGRVKGKGYKQLEGEVENVQGTFSGIIVEKSGWRTIIEVETHGNNAQRFMADLDTFFKKLDFNYKVK